MNLKRDFVSINDLTNNEVQEIFDLTDEYVERLSDSTYQLPGVVRGRLDEARGFILATLFYEPSTRTRLSFESAMIRLGGEVLGTTDPINSSVSKGESIADTVRVIENYADLIVMRHSMNGGPRVAAEYASIPIINGGDGSHEHPTQTLCDLYALRRELQKQQKSLRDVTVLLVGDLKNGRTAHSLAYALARFGANIVTMPAKGLELPNDVCTTLQAEYGCLVLRQEGTSDITAGNSQVDAVFVAPNHPSVEPTLLSGGLAGKKMAKSMLKSIDACYVTRLQDERLSADERVDSGYPVINQNFLKNKPFKHTLIMHPLPRVNELGYDLDKDPRALYFKQMAYSVPIRMALIAKLLRIRPFAADRKPQEEKHYSHKDGIQCRNSRCVTQTENRYISSKFSVIKAAPMTLRCEYCGTLAYPTCIGDSKARTYSLNLHALNSAESEPNAVFFADPEQAERAGYKPDPRPDSVRNRRSA